MTRVTDEHISRGIYGEPCGGIEPRRVAAGIDGTGESRAAGDGGDHAGGGDFPDRVVAGIGDENISSQ